MLIGSASHLQVDQLEEWSSTSLRTWVGRYYLRIGGLSGNITGADTSVMAAITLSTQDR